MGIGFVRFDIGELTVRMPIIHYLTDKQENTLKRAAFAPITSTTEGRDWKHLNGLTDKGYLERKDRDQTLNFLRLEITDLGRRVITDGSYVHNEQHIRNLIDWAFALEGLRGKSILAIHCVDPLFPITVEISDWVWANRRAIWDRDPAMLAEAQKKAEQIRALAKSMGE